MKKFKFEEWLDEKGGGCELILICLFWKFIFALKDNTEKVIEYVKASELSIRFAEDSTIIVCDTIPSVVKIELIEVKQKRYGEVHKNANF